MTALHLVCPVLIAEIHLHRSIGKRTQRLRIWWIAEPAMGIMILSVPKCKPRPYQGAISLAPNLRKGLTFILAQIFDHAGNCIDHINICKISPDGHRHTVPANLLLPIAGTRQ